MITEVLPKKQYEDWTFDGAFAYIDEKSGRVFLLSKMGTSLIVDRSLHQRIFRGQVNDSLKKKLIGAGFSNRFCLSDPKKEKLLPRFFLIDFTKNCNMNCFYCLRDEKCDDGISYEQLDKILNFIIGYYKDNRLDGISIQPWGGEPLLEIDKILHMNKVLVNHGVSAKITIQTNGLLLNQKNAELLHQSGIRVGISLDGVSYVHDQYRRIAQSGSHRYVEAAVKMAKALWGDDVGIISVNTKCSLEHIEESLNYFAKDLCLKSVKFNFVHPNIDIDSKDIVIENHDVPKFYDTLIGALIKLNHEGYAICETNIKDKLMNLLFCEFRDLCRTRGCLGGYSFVTFDRFGDIYPCEMVDKSELKMGNIDTFTTFDDMIKNNQDNKFFGCKKCCKTDCEWFTYCRGGCTASIITNNYGAYDEKECAINRYLYPKLIEMILSQPLAVKALTGGKADLVTGE